MDERFPGSPAPDAPPPYLGATGQGAGQVSDRMQSLLSRAVEDQMAEQRQLQLLVNDIRASIAQLQHDVRQGAATQSVDSVRTEVATLGTEFRSATGMLGERIEAVVRAVTASVQAVQAVSGQLERVHEQLAQQQQSLAALPATVQRAAVEAAPSDAAVRAELTALRAEVAQMRAATADLLRGEVGAVAQTLRAEIEVVRDAVAGAQTRGDEATRRLAEHVDTAVLALAEALLRRRPAAAGRPAADSAAEPVASLTATSEPEAATHSGVTSAAAPRLAPPVAQPSPGAAEPAAPVAGETAALLAAVHPADAVSADDSATAAADAPAVAGDDLGHALTEDAPTVDEDSGDLHGEPEDDAAIAVSEPERADVGLDDEGGPGLQVASEAAAVDLEPAGTSATSATWEPPAVEPDAAAAPPAPPPVEVAEVPLEIAPEPASFAAPETSAERGWSQPEPEWDGSESAPQPTDDVEHLGLGSATEGGAAPAAPVDEDDDAELRWSAADDRPQAAFTMGRGWDTTRERDRRDETADDGEAEGEGQRERRRPWWRPGG